MALEVGHGLTVDRPAPRRGPQPRFHLRWWHEVMIVAVGYAFYTVIRNAVPTRQSVANQHAYDVINWERTLHLFHEHGLNVALAAHHALAVFANYWYALAHFVVTIVVGIWVLAKHPRHARPLRIAWYSMNIVALVGFALFPLAPPRLAPGEGFIDTVVQLGTWGSWGSHGIDSASNQYAAMPSMHIGWSLWCAVVIVGLARHWWVKALGAAYPLMTLGIILGTANHYVLDALGGVLALLSGFLIQRIITGRRAFVLTDPPAPTGDIAAVNPSG